MNVQVTMWQSLAGLAIFMLGMFFMERSLGKLSGRAFKLLLRKYARNDFRSVLGGSVVSALLQSSSIINLIVLAFVGAGVLSLQNALAAVLGANLGTTLNSWLLALFGFSYPIEVIAWPLITFGGILMVISSKEKKIFSWSQLSLGLGFIFLGLYFIRIGTQELVGAYDFTWLVNKPAIVFFFAGIVITSLIQSSSATMAIMLSLLYADAIPFLSAAAVILGSEVGTVSKLIFVSLRGLPTKRRLAAGTFLFNIVPAIPVLIFIRPITDVIIYDLGLKNNLIALAAFQTLVNILSLLLFFPILKWMAFRLNALFTAKGQLLKYLPIASTANEKAIQEAFKKETRLLINDIMEFILTSLKKDRDSMPQLELHDAYDSNTPLRKYQRIKEIHGQIRLYYIEIKNRHTHYPQLHHLQRLMNASRNALYAAKSIKNILQDIEQLSNSSSNVKFDFFTKSSEKTIAFIRAVQNTLDIESRPDSKALMNLYKEIEHYYDNTLENLYKGGRENPIGEADISTLINFNRELAGAHKSLFFAVLYLKTEATDAINDGKQFPGFIR